MQALSTQLLIVPVCPIFSNLGQSLATSLFSHAYKYDSPEHGYVQGHQIHYMHWSQAFNIWVQ